jgi:hypothetical protein
MHTIHFAGAIMHEKSLMRPLRDHGEEFREAVPLDELL